MRSWRRAFPPARTFLWRCDNLLPQVDCLTNLTDNTVVSYLAVVLDKANAPGKPVFGSEIEQVKNGCIASEGVEYISLGQQTGRMAAQVLDGAFAGDIPFVSSEGGDMCYQPRRGRSAGRDDSRSGPGPRHRRHPAVSRHARRLGHPLPRVGSGPLAA